MARPIRVLMLIGAYHPEISGGASQCRTLVLALRDLVRFTVLATTRDPELAGTGSVDGVVVERIHVDPSRRSSEMAAAVRLLARLPALLRHVDVVHFHGFSRKMALALPLAKVMGKRLLGKMASVGLDDPVSLRSGGTRSASWMLRNTDCFVSLSPAMSAQFARAAIPDHRVVFIPNGVDVDRFRPPTSDERIARKRALAIPADAITVAFVGFWSEDKAPDTLFDAWQHARRARPDARLLLVGATGADHVEVSPTLVATLRRRIADEGMTPYVTVVEKTHDVPAHLHAADVFAMPSRREGLPNALLEAMACALPCVASRLPGITDWLIEDGSSGLLVGPGDVAGFAEALGALFRDRERAVALGQGARARVAALCHVDRVAERYLGVYERLVRR